MYTPIFFDQIIKESMILVVLVSAPPVIGCVVVGLIVAIIQSATQVQEQSISFLTKLVVVTITAMLFGDWGARYLGSFFMKIINSIQYIGNTLN